MPRKTFVAGEVLAAADVNEFLADQAVMTFAGTAARGSAISVPVEGMVTYLEDSDQLEVYGGTAVGWSSASNFIFGTAVPTDGQVASYSTAVSGWVPGTASGGKLLQVVSTSYGTQQTKSGAVGYTDTGLSATITPTSATSKIIVSFHQTGMYKTGADIVMQLKLVRDATDLINFDSAVAGNAGNGTNYVGGSGGAYLDSPSTTSAITYKTQYQANATGGTIGVQMLSSVSTMTLLEVAP